LQPPVWVLPLCESICPHLRATMTRGTPPLHRGSLLLGLLLAAAAAVALAGGARPSSWLTLPTREDIDRTHHTRWAVLVAGSAGWGNYRHQADICHAYQVLKKGGLSDEHIIVMMADDVADSVANPYPGKVFNKPNGPDVYEGIKIDYSGSDVNAKNVLKVLAGDAKGMAGIGSGRVLASSPEDYVFFYFADHGAPGILGMPSGAFLYADQFVGTLVNRSREDGFRRMVVYIEACESGSIFQGMDMNNTRIYATTAANAVESSWGTYCPGMEPGSPPEFHTCLGDLYSVSFLEDTDDADRRHETLQAQFDSVKERTSNHFTYRMGSHVLQWGDLSFTSDALGKYLGFGNRKDEQEDEEEELGMDEAFTVNPSTLHSSQPSKEAAAKAPETHVPQRDAELVYMTSRYMWETDPVQKAIYQAELQDFVAARQHEDDAVRQALTLLMEDPGAMAAVYKAMPEALVTELSLRSGGLAESVEAEMLYNTAGRPATLQVVDDWECLRGTISGYEALCGPLGQYGMKYSRLFANTCNLGVADPFLVVLADVCQS